MRFLHPMIRSSNLERTLDFFCAKLGFVQLQRIETEKARLTYVVLAAPGDATARHPTLEIIHNWDEGALLPGRTFGHLAFEVENLYETCTRLHDLGIPMLRAPHDGHKAFIEGPDSLVIELLQKGDRLPPASHWLALKSANEHQGN